MRTLFQLRVEIDDYHAIKDQAAAQFVSMSALLTRGLDSVSRDPKLLGQLIENFLAEEAQHAAVATVT